MIIDKQFVEIFGSIPKGARFTWINDSCHSGDLTRGMPGKAAMEAAKHGKEFKNRAHPVPVDIAWRQRVAKSRRLKADSRAFVCGKLDVGFVSGCRSDQTSADAWMGGKYHGALTYYLIKNLRSKAVKTPLLKIAAATSRDLANNGFDQRPQCEGARTKKPFLG